MTKQRCERQTLKIVAYSYVHGLQNSLLSYARYFVAHIQPTSAAAPTFTILSTGVRVWNEERQIWTSFFNNYSLLSAGTLDLDIWFRRFLWGKKRALTKKVKIQLYQIIMRKIFRIFSTHARKLRSSAIDVRYTSGHSVMNTVYQLAVQWNCHLNANDSVQCSPKDL